MDITSIVKDVIRTYFDKVNETNNTENLLNETIAQIAIREELNLEEVNRVVQIANVKIFEKLFDATKDKTLEFGLAQPKEIVPLMEGSKSSISSFEDSCYDIPEQKTIVENKELEIDPEELAEMARKLFDRRAELKLELGERRPLIKTLIKKKLQNNNPQSIIVAIKEASVNVLPLVRQVCEENNLLIKEANYDPNAILKSSKDFLSDIKTYGRMKNELEKVSSDLNKVATIGQTLKGVSKIWNRVNAAKKLQDSTKKMKQLQNQGGDTRLKQRGGIRKDERIRSV